MTTIATRAYPPAARLPALFRTRRWPAPIPAIAAVVALGAVFFPTRMLGDPDTWWHVVTGNLILDTGIVPTTDPFTFTMPGAPWTAHEWLAEAFLALAFRMAGWSGVVGLAGLAFAAAALIFARRLARDLSGLALVATLTLGLEMILPTLLARPHLLALPFMVTWMVGLLDATEERRAPSVWLLPVMVVWANLHGSFTLGLAMIGPFALEALLAAPVAQRAAVVADWALFGVGALAAAVISPHGVHGLTFPFELMSMKSLAAISEWQPTSFGSPSPVEFALVCLVGVALRLQVRVPLIRTLVLLALLHMALSHARHQLVLGMIAPLLLAAPLRDALAQSRSTPPFAKWFAHPVARRARPWLSAGALLAACLVLAIRLAMPVERENNAIAPIDALAAVPPSLRAQPVLNSYGMGGYFIFEGVRTYIDGRADMFGDTFIDEFLHATRPEPKLLDAVLSRYGIQWTIFPPADAIVLFLDVKPGWKRLFADEFAVVHVRDGSVSDDANTHQDGSASR